MFWKKGLPTKTTNPFLNRKRTKRSQHVQGNVPKRFSKVRKCFHREASQRSTREAFWNGLQTGHLEMFHDTRRNGCNRKCAGRSQSARNVVTLVQARNASKLFFKTKKNVSNHWRRHHKNSTSTSKQSTRDKDRCGLNAKHLETASARTRAVAYIQVDWVKHRQDRGQFNNGIAHGQRYITSPFVALQELDGDRQYYCRSTMILGQHEHGSKWWQRGQLTVG